MKNSIATRRSKRLGFVKPNYLLESYLIEIVQSLLPHCVLCILEIEHLKEVCAVILRKDFMNSSNLFSFCDILTLAFPSLSFR